MLITRVAPHDGTQAGVLLLACPDTDPGFRQGASQVGNGTTAVVLMKWSRCTKSIIDRPGGMAFSRCKIICLILWQVSASDKILALLTFLSAKSRDIRVRRAGRKIKYPTLFEIKSDLLVCLALDVLAALSWVSLRLLRFFIHPGNLSANPRGRHLDHTSHKLLSSWLLLKPP